MKLTKQNLPSYRDTVRLCAAWAQRYALDVVPYLTSFNAAGYRRLYDYVRALPYVRDSAREIAPGLVAEEVLVRPAYVLEPSWQGPRDCEDKHVVLRAAATLCRLGSRFAVVGQPRHDLHGGAADGRPHHIYLEVRGSQDPGWIPSDATFPDRSEFGRRLYAETFREIFFEKLPEHFANATRTVLI